MSVYMNHTDSIQSHSVLYSEKVPHVHFCSLGNLLCWISDIHRVYGTVEPKFSFIPRAINFPPRDLVSLVCFCPSHLFNISQCVLLTPLVCFSFLWFSDLLQVSHLGLIKCKFKKEYSGCGYHRVIRCSFERRARCCPIGNNVTIDPIQRPFLQA